MTQRLLSLLPALALVGCVDPLAEDGIPPRDIIFHFDVEADERPTPREVAASSHDWGVDKDLAEEIAEYDMIEGDTIPRVSAFSGGENVWYWDFGTSPTFAAPLWRLVDPFSDPVVPLDHPPIWDVAPGDPAYSPYWRVYDVPITDKYNGERLISRRALDEALELGLILPPQRTDLYVNCPVVDENVRMQVHPDRDYFQSWEREECPGNDAATCIAPHFAYYKGVRVAYFDTNGGFPIDPDGEMTQSTVYEIRRESESQPLSEPVRGVDITGDEDAIDTNDIFPYTPCSPDYTPVHDTTEVFVVSTYASIDTNESQAEADAQNRFDLFNGNGSPRTALVRGLAPNPTLRNLAIETPEACPPADY